jgi:hypothetical protein
LSDSAGGAKGVRAGDHSHGPAEGKGTGPRLRAKRGENLVTVPVQTPRASRAHAVYCRPFPPLDCGLLE